MKPNDIRELIAKGRLEPAIRQAEALTKETELKNLGIGISSGYRQYKKESIAGTLSFQQKTQINNSLTQQLLDLLNEYELYQVKTVKSNVDKLKVQLAQEEEPVMSAEKLETISELEKISQEMQEVEYIDQKKDVKPGMLARMQQFLEKVQDPDSSYARAITSVKNGYNVLQDLAAGYNSIAEWLALPQVPRVLLKKENR